MNIEGSEHIPQNGKLIVCCNHPSLMDPVLLGTALKRDVRFMAKRDLFKNPFRGKFFHMLGAIPVKPNSADSDAIKSAIEILSGGEIVGIFPQGRCVPTNMHFVPKAGVAMIAFYADSPVVPATIYCEGAVRFFNKITIRFGTPITVKELGFTNGSRTELKYAAKLIAEKVNALLEEKS